MDLINWSHTKLSGGMDMTVASQVKKTLATLKGNQGTLRLYALQTQDEETKRIYEETLVITEGIIQDLAGRVQALEYEEPQYQGN